MHIWLLSGEYPPEYGGGIATYAFHTAQMLAQRGHTLTVFAASEALPDGARSEEIAEGVRVVRFGRNQAVHSAALGEFARWSLDAAEVLGVYLRREGVPDVLESQDYLGLAYFFLQRRRLGEAGFSQLPVLVTAHTPLYVCYRYDGLADYRFPGWWIGEMERFSYLAADWVTFPSAALRREIESDLPSIAAFSSVIPNPYEESSAAFSGLPAQERRGFLFTAKIERRKGIEPLLKTFQRLWQQGLDEPLILLGGDWYDERHQRWMSEVLHTRYRPFIERGLLQWRGKQPPAEVQQTLRQVRGMILPSLFENYPYAVLEAMAAGCPVVVSASGGHAEIVQDGVSGFVFSHQKPGDLEQKISTLLGMSPLQWQTMSDVARRRVQQLSAYAVVAPQKEAALQNAIERGRAERRLFPFLREIPRAPALPSDGEAQQAGMLSLVIPFYNLGEYLEDTLRSLVGLEDIPFEIVVVDDGSDDPLSLQKLEELEKRYAFRLLRTENQGLASARNYGARQARGEFLAFLDADDCMDVQFYREALAVLRKYENVSFVGCWAEYFGEAQGYWPTWNPEPPFALVHNPINSSALVVRRADFLRYGLNDPAFNKIMEDYDSLLSLLENGCRGVVIPKPYFKYRVRGSSMYHDTTVGIKIQTYEQLIRKHAGLYQQFVEGVIGLINANGPGYLYDNPTLWYPAVDFSRPQPDETQVVTSSTEMPPAPARVYLYFALRSMLLKPYNWLQWVFPAVDVIKSKIKRRVLKEKDL
jgi:glycosyltransferase involved in cell wall biosynthesis